MAGYFTVHHILANSRGSITEILAAQANLGADETLRLLRLGSVWADHERTRENFVLESGTYIRVHAEPRRFPASQINWRSTIIHECEDFLVIQKPAGIPVHATVDNWVENVIYSLEQELGHPVFVTQRLDTPTEGVFVLAKTKWFQGQFNKLLRERRLKKKYQALVENDLPAGELVHYMAPALSAPRVVTAEPKPDWQECRLIIEKTTPHPNGFLVDIELLTGRTHQIRAQLSHMGCPILGDSMYGSTKPNPWAPNSYATDDAIALRAHSLEFQHPSQRTQYLFECKPSNPA